MDKELRKKYELPVEKLRYNCDPKEFKPTDKIEPGLEAIIIGQERAVESIQTGLKLNDKHSNIFLTGQPGLGRTEIIETVLKQYIENLSPEEHAKKTRQRRDLLAAYNFKTPENPLIIELPQGFGEKFEKDLDQAINYILKDGIKKYEKQFETVFVADNIKLNTLSKKLKAQQEKLEKEDQKIQAEINRLKKLLQEAQNTNEKEDYNKKIEKLSQEYNEMDQDSLEKELKIQAEMDALQSQNTTGQKSASKNYKENIIKPELDKLKNKYPTQKIKNYLEQLEESIMHDITTEISVAQMQVGAKMGGNMMQMQMPPPPDRSPYKVKILNKIKPEEQIKGIPVIKLEEEPSFDEVFGYVRLPTVSPTGMEISKKDQHLRLEAGSLIKANGGYIIAKAMETLQESSLIRLIKDLSLAKTNIKTTAFQHSIKTKSQDIKLKIQALLTGTDSIYQILQDANERDVIEFDKTLSIKSELSSVVGNTPKNRELYSKYISRICTQQGFKHLTPEGKAEIINYSSRLAGTKGKLITKLSKIESIIRESNLEAKDSKEITAEHVKKAIEAKKKRHNLTEERYQEFIDEDIFVVNTSGEAIGELNGLAVLTKEDIQFGKPSRITSTKPVDGKGWIKDIHDQIDCSGPSKKMGDHILNMIAKERYASPLSKSYVGKGVEFESTLVHEQTYSMIDGDSASSTGLYTALSAIGQFPLDQGIAVTGRVSQKEEVQAIGGVNEKIEGFYMTCKAKGLTGDQGVMIPKINERDLMLSEELIESVKQGDFHIYSVSSIKEGFEVLSGFPMDEIDKKVSENLKKFIPSNEE